MNVGEKTLVKKESLPAIKILGEMNGASANIFFLLIPLYI
jgi:hypothetical protein